MKKSLAISLSLLLPGLLPAQSYFFTDLGTLGGTDSYANGINNRGEIVGTARTTGNLFSRAFVFRNGVMSDIGASADSDTYGFDINGSGDIVGVIDNIKGAREGFLFVSGQLTSLGDFEPEAINDSRVIAGSYSRPAPQGTGYNEAIQSYNGILTNLGRLPGTYRAYAKGINSSGQIVGYCYFPGDFLTYAFRHSNQIVDIGTLSGGYTRAEAINNRGEIVGTSQIRDSNGNGNRVSHAFLFLNGTMTDLGTLGDPLNSFSVARAISNPGIVVGWSDNRAVIFRGGRARDLNLLAAIPSGYTLIDALDVNDAGQIVGNAKAPNGTTHAFLLTPDKRRPSIQVMGPVRRVSGDSAVAVKGRAKDNLQVDRIEYRIGNGRFRMAAGSRYWRFKAALPQGRNRIQIRAIDGAGNPSRITNLTLIRS